MNNCKITCVSHYVPEKIVHNDELAEFVDTNNEWIMSRTGIERRHISQGENTSHMAVKVCKEIIAKRGIAPEDIDLIIVATITPDYMTPSVACLCQGEIGAVNAAAFDINAACSGFVYALSTAEKFIKSKVYKNAIVIGADLLSKMLDWTDRSTCVLFGDGAGGVFLEASEDKGYICEDLHANGVKGLALKAGRFPVVNPFAKEPDEGNRFVEMSGREILDFTVKEVPKCINRILDKAGFSFDDIKYIIPHQANLKMVQAIAKKLNLDMSKFYTNIQNYGNTTAASIPIALSEMVEKGIVSLGSKDKILFVGFGGGLTWGSILIEI